MSHSENGKAEHQSLREQYEELIAHDDSKLLPDLGDVRPALRRFLVGGDFEGRRWPAGRMSLARKGREMCLTLTLDDFEIQAQFFADTFEALLFAADNDLENKRVSWDRTWPAKQRERQAWKDACKGRS